MPPGLPSVDAVAAHLEPGIPAFLKDWLRRFPWLPYATFVMSLLILLLLFLSAATGLLLIVGLAAAAAMVYLGVLIMKWPKELKGADSLKSDNQTPQSIDAMPRSSDFRLATLDENFTPTLGGTSDNQNAQLFKDSLKDMFRLMLFANADMPKEQAPILLELTAVSTRILDQIRPEKTVPAWTWQHVYFPEWIKLELADEGFVEAMGYPKINTAMYEALKKISDELFLPNIQRIEHNSITLLETNQKFIESYMVGLNHEFARELLWREYPTDQRGSYFRQFWDVSSFLKDPALPGKTEQEKREPYYDTPKLHEWRRSSKLGSVLPPAKAR